MSSVLIIIIALTASNFHGSEVQCKELTVSLARLAASDSLDPNVKSVHFDEDLHAIIKFKKRCKK